MIHVNRNFLCNMVEVQKNAGKNNGKQTEESEWVCAVRDWGTANAREGADRKKNWNFNSIISASKSVILLFHSGTPQTACARARTSQSTHSVTNYSHLWCVSISYTYMLWRCSFFPILKMNGKEQSFPS